MIDVSPMRVEYIANLYTVLYSIQGLLFFIYEFLQFVLYRNIEGRFGSRAKESMLFKILNNLFFVKIFFEITCYATSIISQLFM